MLFIIVPLSLLWFCAPSTVLLIPDQNDTSMMNRLFILEQELHSLRDKSLEMHNFQSTLNKQLHTLFATLSNIELSLKEEISQLNSLVLSKNAVTSTVINNLSMKVGDLEMRMNETLKNNYRVLTNFNAKQNHIESKFTTEVAFTADLIFNTSISDIKKHDKIVFGHKIFNDGNAYDTATGVFTAPVYGAYVFYFNINTLPHKSLQVELTVNGNGHSAMAYAGALDVDVSGSSMVILNLHEGDRVWLRSSSDSAASKVVAYQLNSFSGFLLYKYY